MKVSHVTTRLIRTPADNPLVVGHRPRQCHPRLRHARARHRPGPGRHRPHLLRRRAVGRRCARRWMRSRASPSARTRCAARRSPPSCRQAAGSSGPGGIFALALSAVDIALWDIKGKALGQPLATLLGGHRDRVPTYASGALMRPHPVDYLAKAGPRLKGMGFRQMKMQCGAEALPAREVERVRVMRGVDRRRRRPHVRHQPALAGRAGRRHRDAHRAVPPLLAGGPDDPRRLRGVGDASPTR